MKKDALYEVNKISDLKDMINQSVNQFENNNAFLVRTNNGRLKGITYSEFKADINALGTVFMNMGLKDKFIGIIGENRYEWCVSYLSVVNGTGIAVPLDKELSTPEIENLLKRSGVEVIIFSGKYRSTMEDIQKRVPGIKYYIDMDSRNNDDKFLSYDLLVQKGKILMENKDKSFINAKVSRTNMSILLFTSGTTDNPKGVMLSHKNICSNIMSVSKTVYLDSADVTLSILPLHHTYECTIGFLTVVYRGGCISFNQSLKYITDNLKETRPTIMVTVPLLLESVYKKIHLKAAKQKLGKFKLKAGLALSSLVFSVFKVNIGNKLFKPVHESLGGRMRMIVSGAAPLNECVCRDFWLMGIPVMQGYGLTECSPLVTGNRDNDYRYASIGLPIPEVQVRIHKPDSKGIGEILVKGDNVMLGYYRNSAATNKVLKNGWFYTGDIGYMDKDGFFYITGRSKNVIVTKNGKNIYPEELETRLNQSPYILESLVTGKEDEKSGQTVVSAQVFPDIEFIKEKFKSFTPSKAEIKKIVNDAVKTVNKSLMLYQHIREFTIRETEFVKTTTRKIKRHIKHNKKVTNPSCESTKNS